jgi:hypothetical protein
MGAEDNSGLYAVPWRLSGFTAVSMVALATLSACVALYLCEPFSAPSFATLVGSTLLSMAVAWRPGATKGVQIESGEIWLHRHLSCRKRLADPRASVRAPVAEGVLYGNPGLPGAVPPAIVDFDGLVLAVWGHADDRIPAVPDGLHARGAACWQPHGLSWLAANTTLACLGALPWCVTSFGREAAARPLVPWMVAGLAGTALISLVNCRGTRATYEATTEVVRLSGCFGAEIIAWHEVASVEGRCLVTRRGRLHLLQRDSAAEQVLRCAVLTVAAKRVVVQRLLAERGTGGPGATAA